MYKMNRRSMLMSSAAVAASASFAGRVSAQTASTGPDALKSSLTPLGAERAGNAYGSIPAWTGGYSTLPPGFKPGDVRPVPFADEKPLFTITAANLSQYQDKLAGGVVELFKRNSDYRMDVYTTHRTASAPQYVYDYTYKNASTATISADGNSIANAFGGPPFPIPKNGYEVVWNHLLAWKGTTIHTGVVQYQATSAGNVVLDSLVDAYFQFPYYIPEREVGFDGFYEEFTARITAPPYQAGGADLAIYPMDAANVPQETWQYLVGQRRTRKAPELKYDTPDFFASGIGNFDESQMFSGPLDEYDFKLLGKKEMYIPYNCNALWAVPSEIQVGPHFVNPNLVRWELHRVWVVEMTLHPGKRNVDTRRLLYTDEDTWNAVMCDVYDSSQTYWKFILGMPVVLADIPCVLGSYTQAVYDFHAGDYVLQYGASPSVKPAFQPIPVLPSSFFSPGQLAAMAGGE